MKRAFLGGFHGVKLTFTSQSAVAFPLPPCNCFGCKWEFPKLGLSTQSVGRREFSPVDLPPSAWLTFVILINRQEFPATGFHPRNSSTGVPEARLRVATLLCGRGMSLSGVRVSLRSVKNPPSLSFLLQKTLVEEQQKKLHL